MNPINEHGETIEVYPHRLLFLCPRQANENTPPHIKKWLDFIEDSLDGEMDESHYKENIWQKIIAAIEKRSIDPALLSEIKDDKAWEEVKKHSEAEGLEKGLGIGLEKGRQEMLKQQQQTVRKARKMGLDDNAIVELTRLRLVNIKAVED